MTDEPDPVDLPDLPRGIALSWGMAASPQRGPKREMSVERIVEAAVDLADREGLGAVSMAAVAKALGFTPMSLYRYVSAKDDLLLLMQEEASGAPALPDAGTEGGDWRGEAERLYRAQLEIYLAHPWLLSLPINGTPATPSTVAWMDAYLGAFADTPLDLDDRTAAMLAIMGQARWYGTVAAGYAEAARAGGLSVAEVGSREAALFLTLVDADAYPHTRAALEAGVMTSDRDSMAFGIVRLLDGIAAYIDRVAATGLDARAVERAPLPDDPALAADKRVRAAAKTVREAEKALRAAQKNLRQVRRDAAERIARSAG
ncbi:TetR/AcrR family transcriptional regulator [Microbacterium azadirachtae]|uniref:TetR/AcrR family transcriptional regulator n=1 Tax=Microbacterium azadirachtae TaxID=582680 RepID=UPI00088CE23C|nr:TetR/AcrR family transcriptional regulator [Microbacterium azadirachtae]SDL86429.1 Tetracyclin repressor, C-terminal all-alpha domain [Microbacterium azadirachtae]SEG20780.1 Tetracyclin repressor, C-terminal all-alpha domain [Microbacterium azadirachtae]SEG23066.1 Tetracyclin repressor, C-terminal all-alpha domain [Microbacterium azadirachtae]